MWDKARPDWAQLDLWTGLIRVQPFPAVTVPIIQLIASITHSSILYPWIYVVFIYRYTVQNAGNEKEHLSCQPQFTGYCAPLHKVCSSTLCVHQYSITSMNTNALYEFTYKPHVCIQMYIIDRNKLADEVNTTKWMHYTAWQMYRYSHLYRTQQILLIAICRFSLSSEWSEATLTSSGISS